jgi:two-component sensor histidine kinase
MLPSVLPKEHLVIESWDEITLANAQHLLAEKDLLLEEMQHRLGNSLQIIASILLIKARTVQSEETRSQLLDTHQRVLSVAAVQKHLRLSGPNQPIDIANYLTKLCETLARSMIDGSRPTALKVEADFNVVSARNATSLGLIVTELVMNALKHAFVYDRSDAAIVVSYAVTETGWKLVVCDNGGGIPKRDAGNRGLGTGLILALARLLDARVDNTSDSSGTAVSITHLSLKAAPSDAIKLKSIPGHTRSPQ